VLRSLERSSGVAQAERPAPKPGLADVLLEITGDCVKLLDLKGRLLSMNGPGLCAMEVDDFGTIEGSRWSSLWPEAARPDVDAAVAAAADGAVARFAAFAPTAKGAPKWWEVTVAPVPGDDGRPCRLVSVSRDVTALRQAEERLRGAEAFHREAIEHNPNMFWVADAAGSILRNNGARAAFMGRSNEEATGAGWLDFIHRDDRQLYLFEARRSSLARERMDVTVRFLHASGEYRWVRTRAVPKLDDAGRILCWYGYSEDVDGEVRALEALNRSEERLRLVTSAAGIGVYDTGPDGLAICSSRFYEIYGLPLDTEALPFETWLSLVHPDDRDFVRTRTLAAIARGDRVDYEFRILRADTGEVRWIDNRGKLRRDASGAFVRSYGAQWDITERKQAEAELARLQARSLKVSRLNAAGAMATTLAHELNQPLAAVSNYASAARLVAERAGHDEIAGVLRSAAREAVRAGEIVRRLRRFLARGEVERETASLARMVENAIKLVLGTDARRDRPTVDIGPGADGVSVDPVQVEQVLTNLLRNACEAAARRAGARVRIDAAPHEDGFVVVRVTDDGPGVDRAEELFAPFMSTKGGGLGVGLAVARTIVEAHGGRIWHEAPAGGGAVFAFTLPAADSRQRVSAGRRGPR